MFRSFCGFVALWTIFHPSLAAESRPLHPFSYVEDFAEKDPVEAWVSNGQFEVNFKGLTDEKALTGRRSFKLDLTIKSGSYHYWSVPVRVPCAGHLKFSGNIFVAEARGAQAGLGVNYLFPPSTHSGCGAFGTFEEPTDGWKRQETDLVAGGAASAGSVVPHYVAGATGENVGTYVDRWGLFIFGGEGARIVLYVDDVRIEGEVPAEEDYEADIQKRWQVFAERFTRQLEEWRGKIAAARTELSALPELGLGRRNLKDSASRGLAAADEAVEKCAQRGWASPSEMADLQSRTEFISTFKEVAKQVAQVGPDAGCLVHVPQAISNLKVLPQEFPVPAPLSCDLQVTACPGEYEPATFVLYAVRDLANVTVEVSDLVDGPRRLPGNVVDVRVVKCWYQSGTNVGFQNQRLLVPDLLLKDDELVRVDLEKQENFLREVHPAGEAVYLPISTPNSDHLANIHPRDAHHLRPVTLPADSAKQFWLTVHVPPDARPGDYRGTIRLQAAGGNPSAALRAGLPTLHLSLRVLPFPLAAPGLIYSIYYRGVLTPDGQGSISSEQKSPEQYLAEMKNLAAHGVLYPTAYQGYDEALLRPVVQLREQAGLSKGRFFGLGRGTGSPRDQAELDRLAADVKKWRAFLSPFGYHQVYFYGIDEASGEALAAQRAAWKAVHRAGGKTFVACYHGTFEAMGVLLDVAVYAGPPDAHEAKKYHRVRRQIFCYANPQVGVEEPETYRRNFGLLLWKAGYDGAMDYAYQHSFHHIWNDFDDPTYRDHNFTYPTEDGVIDTVEWEGFREGVDDVRYVTTLERCLESAPAGKRKVAKQAREWLDALDPQTADLHETRAKMVEWILRLRQ